MTTLTSLHTTPQLRRHRIGGDVVLFVTLTFAAATALAVALPGSDAEPGPVALLTLLVPALAAGFVRRKGRRRWPASDVATGVRRPGLAGWPAALALPIVAIGGSLALARLLGIVGFHDLGHYLASAPGQLAFLSVLLLGEELGWRGYLLPRLQSVWSPRAAALATGLVHALYHVPLLTLTNAYDSDGRRVIVVPGVVAVIGAGGAVFGWLRVRYDSLWPVLIAHATVNLCLLTDPELVSDNADRAAHLTGEGGILTVLTVALVAFGVLRYAPWPGDAPSARRAR